MGVVYGLLLGLNSGEPLIRGEHPKRAPDVMCAGSLTTYVSGSAFVIVDES